MKGSKGVPRVGARRHRPCDHCLAPLPLAGLGSPVFTAALEGFGEGITFVEDPAVDLFASVGASAEAGLGLSRRRVGDAVDRMRLIRSRAFDGGDRSLPRDGALANSPERSPAPAGSPPLVARLRGTASERFKCESDEGAGGDGASSLLRFRGDVPDHRALRRVGKGNGLV
jgi:hypothetical protein